jgi:ribosomal protein S18 acetylase RimI-like enzyme
MYRLTVNTQSDNAASLALYRKTGFHETGERYPVYQLPVPFGEGVSVNPDETQAAGA